MKITKKLSAAALSLGLVVGMSGLASAATGSISNTGPDSWNKVKSKVVHKVNVNNNNNVAVGNLNMQHAMTGNASSHGNTTSGDATTGSASNANAFTAAVSVSNPSSSAAVTSSASAMSSDTGSISNTGPDSSNVVTSTQVSKVEVNNDNNILVGNINLQHAMSGDASVYHNTTGGSATSGDATNTNSSSVTVNVTN